MTSFKNRLVHETGFEPLNPSIWVGSARENARLFLVDFRPVPTKARGDTSEHGLDLKPTPIVNRVSGFSGLWHSLMSRIIVESLARTGPRALPEL